SYFPRWVGSPPAVAATDTRKAFHLASWESTETLRSRQGIQACSSVPGRPGECHVRYAKRRRCCRAAELEVIGDRIDSLEDFVEVRRDGHLADRERQLAVIDPEPLRAARKVTRDRIEAEPHEVRDVETAPGAP